MGRCDVPLSGKIVNKWAGFDRILLPTYREGREAHVKLYTDIAHPINPSSRKNVEEAVLAAYEQEQKRTGRGSTCSATGGGSQEPGS